MEWCQPQNEGRPPSNEVALAARRRIARRRYSAPARPACGKRSLCLFRRLSPLSGSRTERRVAVTLLFYEVKKETKHSAFPQKRSYLYLSKDAKGTKLVCMEHKNRVRRRWGLPLALCLLVLLAVVSGVYHYKLYPLWACRLLTGRCW